MFAEYLERCRGERRTQMQTWCSVNNKNSRKSFEYHHLILVSSRMKATLHGTDAGH